MLGALIGLAGGLLANKSRSDEASENRGFQADMANTSYQRAMADMKAAGLNPMLAYSQGGAHVPAGAMAQVENVGSAAMVGHAQEASAESSLSQARLGDETVQKIKQEVVNLKSTDDQINAIVRNLREEYYNLIENRYNLIETREQIRSTVAKLRKETENLDWAQLVMKADEMLKATGAELNKFEIQSAERMENLGRDAKQLQPVFEILRAIIGVGRGR